jgi:hypothetical protein
MRTRLMKVALVTVLSVGVAGNGVAQTTQAAAPRPGVTAQAHVASGDALDRLVTAEVVQQDADRKAIRDLLQRDDVREIAEHAGLDIRKAEAAVDTLSGKELQDAALRARHAQEQLAGGGSSITIGTTTLIIILLVVILIIVAVK